VTARVSVSTVWEAGPAVDDRTENATHPLLGLNREAGRPEPCGIRHKESRDSQARHSPASCLLIMRRSCRFSSDPHF